MSQAVPVIVEQNPKLDPRLAMLLAFEGNDKVQLPSPCLVVELNQTTLPKEEDPPGPSSLPGKWSYLWGIAWSVELPTLSSVRDLIKDERVKYVALDS